MPYLIDGHNLIAALPNLDLSDLEDERKLIEMLQSFCVQANRRATVYFDRASPGGNPKSKHGRVEVRFIRSPRTADDAIRDHLGNLGKEARNWTVVSSDREVCVVADQHGAQVLSSGEFALSIAPETKDPSQNDKPPQPLSDKDVADWEKLFNERD